MSLGKLGGRGGMGKLGGLAGGGKPTPAVPPIPDVMATPVFDWQPARDGMALLRGGPTLRGYAADKIANPSRLWTPRLDNGSQAAKGGSDVPNGAYHYNVDPEYAWTNGLTPFSIESGKGVITGQTTPAANTAEMPINPVTGSAYSYASGTISTINSFAWGSGYWEFDAILPKGRSSWPAGWLIPVVGQHPPEPDIMEFIFDQDGANKYRVNAIAISGQNAQTIDTGVDLSLASHKYGMLLNFSNRTMQFYFDRVAVGSPISLATRPEFIQKFYFILGLQIGSTLSGWVLPPNGTTPSPMKFIIDHATVWPMPGPNVFDISNLAYIDSAVVGDTVATLSSSNADGNSAYTFTENTDPDNVFTITSGGLVKLSAAVPETTKTTHQFDATVTDGNGRTASRLFTLRAVRRAVTTNLAPSQNLWTAPWSVSGLSPVGSTNNLRETATTSTHVVYTQNFTRAAGAKTLRVTIDVQMVGRDWLCLQAWDANFGSSNATAFFDVKNGLTGYFTQSGAWTNCAPVPPAPVPGSPGRYYVGFDVRMDASTSNMTVQIGVQDNAYDQSYLGDITKGINVSDVSIRDVTPSQPFTPLLAGNAAGWWDATDAATVTQSANAVSQWNDKSGNARHVAQAGASTIKPTYDPSGFISFDGGDYLFNTAPFMYANGKIAVYAVINASNTTGLTLLGEGAVAATPDGYTFQGRASSTDMAGFIRNGAGTSLLSNAAGVGGVFFDGTKKLVRLVDNGALLTGYANGTVGTTPRSYTRSGTLTLDRFAIGGYLRFNLSGGFIGNVYELIVATDDAYGQEYEGYLAWKHGLQASLPAGHPYRTVQPTI